jgi:hypothetical protein
MIIVAALALSGCATVGALRERPAILDQTSAKPLGEFQACFAKQFDRQIAPRFLPAGTGGTYTYEISNTVFWVLDVEVAETGTRAILHGGDAGLVQQIKACL